MVVGRSFNRIEATGRAIPLWREMAARQPDAWVVMQGYADALGLSDEIIDLAEAMRLGAFRAQALSLSSSRLYVIICYHASILSKCVVDSYACFLAAYSVKVVYTSNEVNIPISSVS